MSARDIIDTIIHDNELFVKAHTKEYFATHQGSQQPAMTMVTCSDSRVQPQVIAADAINRVFLIENIGNQILNNEGSVDYGIYHLKTPVLVVLGHSDCGAVKTFIRGDDNVLPSIQRELDTLRRGLQKYLSEGYEKKGLNFYIEENIHYQVNLAVNKYEQLLLKNLLVVVGAFYDFTNERGLGFGKISLININGRVTNG